jgi:hypothetical protein
VKYRKRKVDIETLMAFTLKKSPNPNQIKKFKKMFQPPPQRQSIFRRPSDQTPKNYGPNASSDKWLHAIARLDAPLPQRGRVNSENVYKKCLNKGCINDSPVIAIVSKLVQFDTRSS